MNKQPRLPGPTPEIGGHANDNGRAPTDQTIKVSCDLPRGMTIITGEAELIARFMGDLLRMTINDK